MGRSPCCDKSKVKRGTWSPEEDAILKNYLHKHGTAGNWIALPQKAGLQRCGKSCRLRWLNYLRPDIKHGGFTHDEEYIICNLYQKIGSRWSVIASHLPGRTDNDVKNYWNTKLKKKFLAANCNPPTKTDIETAIGGTASGAAAATTATTVAASMAARTSQIFPTYLPALQDYCFPPPILSDAQNVSNEPINFDFPRLILEGSSNCSSVNNNFQQDSSPFKPFCVGMDDNNSFEVLSSIWSQEEAAIGADLFSIFHVDSKPQGVGESQ